MRPSALVLLTLALTASTTDPVLAGPASTRRDDRRVQRDAFGRVVYSPEGGRRLYDDRGRTPAGAARQVATAPSLPLRRRAAAAPSATRAVGASGFGLELEWHRIPFGDAIGSAGLQIADVDADGRMDLVAGAWASGLASNRTWYLVSRQGAEYVPEWSSPPLPVDITSVRLAQADADPAAEVLVGAGSDILIYDGASHALERTVVTSATGILGLAVADVDADGSPELVFCDPQGLFIHDLATGAPEFEGGGLGGSDLAVGQADADPALEIAVGNGTAPGFLVDGQSRVVEWSAPEGFGRYVRMGDLDGDGRAEIVAGFAWSRLVVYDAATQGVRYEVPLFNLAAVRLADVEGDGALDLVYADAQWGLIHVVEGASGQEKWWVENPEHGVTDVAVGDLDGDGAAEVVWGAGHTSSGPDHLYVADGASHAIEWQSLDERGPYFGLAYGDVDDDGALEILHAARESDSGYEDGLYFVHDAATKALEYRSPPIGPVNFTGVWRVRAANLDEDPQLELLVTSGQGYQGMVHCFDGRSHEEQWRAAVADGLAVRSLQVADLEGDGSLEVVAGVGRKHTGAPGHFVYVFDGATGSLEWQSPPLDAGWRESTLLRVADVDGDGRLEIVVASQAGPLWVIDGTTRTIDASMPGLSVTALETVDRDADGRAELIVGTVQGQILVVDAVTGAVEPVASYAGAISGLAVADLTGDGTPDYTFCAGDRLHVRDGASGDVVFLSEVLGEEVGAQDSLLAADVDGDGATEVVVNVGVFGLMVFGVASGADTEPPVVSLVAPPAGPVIGTVVVQAEASDDRGVVRVEFLLDGGLLATATSAPYAFAWDTTSVTPGAHVLSASALDAAGNVGTSPARPVTVLDQFPPTAQITEPTGGSIVSGSVVVRALATDNVGVSRVDFSVDGVARGDDWVAPYTFAWDTTGFPNGSHSLRATAWDAAGNSAVSALVTVTVANGSSGLAVYDPALRAPRCALVGHACDSGLLLRGRGPLGPEPNAPNTRFGACPDGSAGVYHSDESNDGIRVSTLDGTPLAPGKTVRVQATVWAWAGYGTDKLDLYSAANAMSPVWTPIATLSPTVSGAQVLATTYVLPTGGVQAVRARFRYLGTAAPCGSGPYNDHDDLVFATSSGPDTAPVVTLTEPLAGATVAGMVGVSASAVDDGAVVKVEFLVDGSVQFTDGSSPWTFPFWDTTLVANGPHTLAARAHDAAGNVGESPEVTVAVQNAPGNAVFDEALRVPACRSVGSYCDSGALLVGRGPVGPEPNQPNTIGGSCADGSDGTFHVYESNDRLKVSTVDGTPFAPGKTVRIEASVWAGSGGGGRLDLYRAANADSPAWSWVTTISSTKIGPHTLQATYTLPAGGLQAVRARFRYLGSAAPCSLGGRIDHDDIVFAVQQ